MKASKKDFKITDVFAFKQFNSKGIPTIGLQLCCDKVMVKSLVPSGTSIGSKEAIELRDNGLKLDGKTCNHAINLINKKIKPILIGKSPFNQFDIDKLLIRFDGTDNKSKLGSNCLIAISMAIAKLAAKLMNIPLFLYLAKFFSKNQNKKISLPKIMVNIVNGGMHANNFLDFQEFMIVPLKTKSLSQACDIASECFYELGKILKKNHLSNAKGDEGGYDVNFKSCYKVFDFIEKSVMNAGYKLGHDVAIALDIAASTLFDRDHYFFKKAYISKEMNKKEATFSSDDLIKFYQSLIKLYPIISIEDPFDENDWKGFIKFNKIVNDRLLIVGDDLYCTNNKLIQNGINLKATNAVIIKPNQIGTIYETITAIKTAKQGKQKIIISHRSGDTEDTFIADLAVACQADYIKTGSFSRSERLAKYNRLLEIENTFFYKRKLFY